MGQPREGVRIVEVGPRDGLQNINAVVPTRTKIELIERLSNTGLQVIEATSFVSPKWIPQLADGSQVMQAINPLLKKSSIRFPVLVPNLKGVEFAHKAGAKEIGVFVSATESFSKKNNNCSVAEALDRARQATEKATSLGMKTRGYVSCIFADPYEGVTDPQKVLQAAKALLDAGCFEVSLGDTLGVGTPAQVNVLLNLLFKEIPPTKLAGHFHDTYGQAVANAIAAYELGLRAFDSSVSGLGGCPFAPGAKGNLASEDIIYAFEKMNIPTGVDLQKLSETGDWISKQIGQANASRAGAALVAKSQTANKSNANREDSSRKSVEWTRVEDTGEYIVYRSGATLKILLNRPKNGNAMTAKMLTELAAKFESLASDTSVHNVVLTANGKFFCTGMDLSSGGATSEGTAAEAKDAQFNNLKRLFEAIDRAPQTTVAVINGNCYGGGVGLAFSCNIRLARADVTFTLSEVKLGLAPATISKFVTREWGLSLTREAFITARPFTASELYNRTGAIHGVASNDKELVSLLDENLYQLSRCAPEASAKSKDLVRAAYEDPGGPEQAKTIRSVYDFMMDSDEAAYGAQEFRARRRNIDWEVAKKKLAKPAKL